MLKPLLIFLTLLLIIAGGALFMLRPEPVSRVEPYLVAQATAEDMQTVEATRVFFAHQSVGDNILDALPAIYQSAHLNSPIPLALDAKLPGSGGFIVHTHIGTNGDPLGKIVAFDRALRSGLGQQTDVAVLKLCFVDFNAETDVNAIFASYRATMASLAKTYPDTRFVYTTVPLMADRDLYGRVKALLGRGQEYDPAHNAARERYNELVRAEYASSGRLFDVAAVQSVGHGDTLRYRSSSNGEFLAMDPALTSDGGHLNHDGADLVARNWLAVVAHASAG